MKISDLVMLTKAGFTKADIEAMGILNSVDEDAAEVKPEEVKVEEKVEEKPEDAFDKRFKSLEEKVDYVVNRFNYLSVKESNQPEQKTESINDILAKVIR